MSKRGNRRQTVIKSNEEKTVLVVGATGATGRLLVRLLLDRGLHVKAVVRASATLPDQLGEHDRLSVSHPGESSRTH
jgi:NADPH:quinone reductase-like Zn-dependent oxidoreductase